MDRQKDFLRKVIEDDLKSGKYKKVITRFPPEPNGFPHIGHAKSISINFGIAKDYGGICNLRMDDTNPTTENIQYVNAFRDAVKWLGFNWQSKIYYTSDYFEKLYQYAVQLIKIDKAYVDSLSEDEIKEYRGTVTKAGKRSKYANRTIEENLNLFERMRKGEFQDGEHVLRAKINMGSPNMKMRDPLLYRIRHANHFRTKDKWCIYPMYDFAHPLSDYIEGVTHSICTLEFENNRDIYNWLLDNLKLRPPRPYQYEFARLNINYTVMSKRRLLELIKSGIVNGWDDPRMPTIAGYKRRGYTAEAILNFCNQIGVAKANSVVDVAQLEFAIRDDLNKKVPRVMCVQRPLKITIENYNGFEKINAPYYPEDIPKEGSREIPFSKEIYIEREDFSDNPPKGYFRLTPNQPVRLRYAYIIRCKEVIKNKRGDIIEIKAEYYPNSKSGSDRSGIKVKSAIQWVEAKNAKRVELRLYDRLFNIENPEGIESINPNSLKIIKSALIEPAVIDSRPDVRFQFERIGYFYADPIDYTNNSPIFNKIVSLKDSWSKKRNRGVKPSKDSLINKKMEQRQIEGEITPMTKEEERLFNRYISEFKLSREVANILVKDKKLSNFYHNVLLKLNSPILVGNMVVNEVARELKFGKEIKFSPKEIADLIQMVEDEIISGKIAKQVFKIMSREGKEPTQIVEDRNLKQISTPDIIMPIINKIIAQNPRNVKKLKTGNKKLFGFFVGEVLKVTNGKANPKVVNRLIKKKLSL